MFSDVLMPEYQLLDCNPKQNRYLAVGLMIRGDVSFSDVSRYFLFF
jgi:tubulin epsilon